MNEKLALEIFGYFGTALVLLSFIMKDIKWLRAINMMGGAISLIYSIFVNAMPVVVLNGSVIIINAIQLTKLILDDRKKAALDNSAVDCAYDEKENKNEEKV